MTIGSLANGEASQSRPSQRSVNFTAEKEKTLRDACIANLRAYLLLCFNRGYFNTAFFSLF